MMRASLCTLGFAFIAARLGILGAAVAGAATYYVDPSPGCSDDNAGTSARSPWCTPPGARNTADTGFLSGGTWGSVSTGHKVACGDTILLRGGATYSSADGGPWRIDESYYRDCTTTTRTTIRVASGAEWAASSGNFVMDFTGMAWTDSPQCHTEYPAGTPSRVARIAVCGVNYVQFGGYDSTRRVEIVNVATVPGRPTVAVLAGDWSGDGGPAYGRMIGVGLSHIYIHDSAGGLAIVGVTGSRVRDYTALRIGGPSYGSGIAGLHYGLNGNPDSNWMAGAEQITVQEVGYGGDDDDGYTGVDCVSCWLIDADLAQNHYRGLNTGQNAGDGPFLFRYRNVRLWNNGLYPSPWNNPGACTGVRVPDGCCTGPGTGYCETMVNIGANFDVSGKHTLAHATRNVIEGMTLVGAYDVGFTAYGLADVDAWHMVLWNNGIDRPSLGNLLFNQGGGRVYVTNSILQKRAPGLGQQLISGEEWDGLVSPPPKIMPRMKTNLLLPYASNTEIMTAVDWSTCADGQSVIAGKDFTFSRACWFDDSNLRGTAYRHGFAQTSGCDARYIAQYPSATCDFTPTASSSGINAGSCFFTTRSGGAGTTLSGLTANGLYGDPRYYFIMPWRTTKLAASNLGMYLDSVGDRIVVGDDRVTVTDLTATAISFTPSITWNAGECVHLAQFTGGDNVPDIGAVAYEAEATATTTSTATTSSTAGRADVSR